jgi:hypothetical protein
MTAFATCLQNKRVIFVQADTGIREGTVSYGQRFFRDYIVYLFPAKTRYALQAGEL